MSYFQFMVPDTWNGYRDIDEKINFDELNKYLEEGEEEDANNLNGAPGASMSQ